MGCDIHLFAEKKVNGKWVTLDKWSDNPDCVEGNDDGERPKIIKWGYGENNRQSDDFYTGGRNYNLFCALAGVRAHQFNGTPPMVAPAKGFPNDACEETKSEYKMWNGDAHTPSWLTLKEIWAFQWSEFYGDTCKKFVMEMIEKMETAKREVLTEDIDTEKPEEKVRIVFWFDN